MKIAIGSDHAGFSMKKSLREFLDLRGIQYVDFGTHSEDSMDYPDVAHPLCNEVEIGNYSFGVLLCGSANGMAISANKHKGIRAAICWNKEISQLARQHNDANVACIPARFVTDNQGIEILDTFLSTAFEGGRHAVRVNKINC